MDKILIGYDGSPESDRALERTAQLAKAFGSHVTVVGVAPVLAPVGRGAGAVDPTESPDEYEAQSDAAAAKLAQLGVDADHVTVVGKPGKAIAELAGEREADLVVVGTRDMNAVERLFAGGSVSDTVHHHAPCDVLIVR